MPRSYTTAELDKMEREAGGATAAPQQRVGLTTAQLDALEAGGDFSQLEQAALRKLQSPQKYVSPGIDVYGPQEMMGAGGERVWQKWREGAGPQMLGGVGMSAIGAGIGSALMPVGGTLLGGMAGSAVGEALGKQEQLRGSGMPPEHVRQEMLQAAKYGAALDFLGAGVGDLLGRAIKGGFAKADKIPGIDRLSNKLKAAGRHIVDQPGRPGLPARARAIAEGRGTFLTAAQRTRNPLLDTMENVAERSYGGGKNLYQIKQVTNPAAYRQLVTDTADFFWDEAGGRMTPQQVANLFTDTVGRNEKNVKKAFARTLTKGLDAIPDAQIGGVVGEALDTSRDTWRQLGRARYGEVDDILRQQGRPITVTRQVPSQVLDASGNPVMQTVTEQSWDIVSMGRTKRLARQLGEEVASAKGLGSADAVLRMTSAVDNVPDNLSFTKADDLRSFLLEEGRKIETELGSRSPRVSRIVAQLQDSVDESMRGAAELQSPEVFGALRDARRFWRTNSELYNTPFVKRMARMAASDDPSKLANYIFAPKAPERAILARRVLGQETYEQVRDTWTQNAFTKALDDPRSIGGAMRKQFNKLGRETMDAMYGADGSRNMYALADMFAREGRASFENKVLRSAVAAAEKNPGTFVRQLITPAGVDQLRQLKRVAPPGTMNKIRALWIEDALNRGAAKGGKDLTGNVVNTFSEILGQLDPAVRKQLFSESHWRELTDVGTIGTILGEPTGGGGGILAPLMEAGAVAGLIVRPKEAWKGSLQVIGAFKVLSEVFGNEKATNWLIDGVKNPRRARFFAQRAIAEVVKAAGRPLAPTSKKRRTPTMSELSGFGGRGF